MSSEHKVIRGRGCLVWALPATRESGGLLLLRPRTDLMEWFKMGPRSVKPKPVSKPSGPARPDITAPCDKCLRRRWHERRSPDGAFLGLRCDSCGFRRPRRPEENEWNKQK